MKAEQPQRYVVRAAHRTGAPRYMVLDLDTGRALKRYRSLALAVSDADFLNGHAGALAERSDVRSPANLERRIQPTQTVADSVANLPN